LSQYVTMLRAAAHNQNHAKFVMIAHVEQNIHSLLIQFNQRRCSRTLKGCLSDGRESIKIAYVYNDCQ
jgi:hypothetical protein